MLFDTWCIAADEIRATTKRLAKGAVLEAYLRPLDDESLALAARFFSGLVFPRHDMRTTQVGGSIVYGALVALSGRDDEYVHERLIALGDLGDLARELLAGRPPSGITLTDAASTFATLAATAGSNAKRALVRQAIEPLGALEACYFVKLVLGGGELRIGLKEAQVEEALARAFGREVGLVRRANLLRGDIGEVACLARDGTLDRAVLALFHPIGFMLAQPLETAEEIAATLAPPFAVEDKYDGIRAQAHVEGGRVALFSRTLDEITHGYPEVAAALGATDSSGGTSARVLPSGRTSSLVLDGELLAYDPAEPGRALPFKALQRRLGRKTLSDELLAELPVMFVAYDILAADGRLVVDESYAERRARLEALGWPLVPDVTRVHTSELPDESRRASARLAPMRLASSAAEIERAFEDARAAGNEGVIVKALSSAYTPGRRGRTWVKLKKAMATLDVVVTGVERGHGRRRGVLSDYTFAVRASASDSTLLNVGKAYNGLTDAEIAALTPRFEALTVQRFGRFHQVRPEVVLEVTFDIVQESKRHKAGYALRFPRIVRVRDDKPVAEIDTLDRVRELATGAESSGTDSASDTTADASDTAE